VASEVIVTEFVVTCVPHTARISNVEGAVCDNEERKMVNVFFSLSHARDKLNIPSFLFLSEFNI